MVRLSLSPAARFYAFLYELSRRAVIPALFLLLPAVSCGTGRKVTATDGDRIAVVAHRGFWKCENAGNSENSIAALVEAQKNDLWGSECDIHLTADKKIIVNHNNTVDGLKIAESSFEDLCSHLLENGERRPSFDEYVLQMKKHPGNTVLVVELKVQPDEEIERKLVDRAIACLENHGMFRPDRVMFISFSLNVCMYLARRAPGFTNQYLNGDLAPKELSRMGINGIDYHYRKFLAHPEWVKEAHDLGMSVNVWTVDSLEMMRQSVEWGVDAITTNRPLVLRELLGNKELKSK